MEVMCIRGLMEINYKMLVSVMILQMLCWPQFANIIATFCLNIYVIRTQKQHFGLYKFNVRDAAFFQYQQEVSS